MKSTSLISDHVLTNSAASPAANPQARVAVNAWPATLNAQALLSATLQATSDAVLAYDGAGAILCMNAKAETLTGWTQSEALGQPLSAVLHVAHDRMQVVSPNLIESPPDPCTVTGRDGTETRVKLTISAVFDKSGNLSGGVAAMLDALPNAFPDAFPDKDTGQRPEEQLRASQEQSRQILHSTRDCIKVLDLDLNLLSMNKEGRQRLGIADFSEVQGKCWLDFWQGGGAAAKTAVDQAFSGGMGQFEGEFITSKGEPTWWDVTVTPILDAAGAITSLLVVSREITTRKQAELALRESAARFGRLIEQSAVGVMIGTVSDTHNDPQNTTQFGALSYINSTLTRLLGYLPHSIGEGALRWDDFAEGQPFWDHTALEQLRQTGMCPPYEKALRTRTARTVPFLLGATVLGTTAQGLEIAVFLTDLSAQKRTEAALLESEKLAAVGKLASSISHEINNPLEAVTNLLYIVRSGEVTADQARGYLAMADKELQRVSQIVAQTLRFHRQSTRPRAIDPAELLDEVLALYAARFNNYSITPLRQFGADARLTCYEDDVRQVLNNLIGNAVDAMRSGGQLIVRTQCATDWRTGRPGVRITVADTGTGMPPPVRNRIFEAFYTTKGIHGTGLGLWISSRIAAKHGGKLHVRSSAKSDQQSDRKSELDRPSGSTFPQHGSVFTLWLPLEPLPPAPSL